MKKTPSMTFFYRKIRTTPKSQLFAELKDAPLSKMEYAFICDFISGLTNSELAEKYYKSCSRVAQVKRELCERLLTYYLNITH